MHFPPLGCVLLIFAGNGSGSLRVGMDCTWLIDK
jgi:hypothetical protein